MIFDTGAKEIQWMERLHFQQIVLKFRKQKLTFTLIPLTNFIAKCGKDHI